MTCILLFMTHTWDVYSLHIGCYIGCICIADWEPLRHVPIWRAFCILGHARVTCILLFTTHTKVAHFAYQVTCNILYTGLVIVANFRYQAKWQKKYTDNALDNVSSFADPMWELCPNLARSALSFLVNSSMRARFEAPSAKIVFVVFINID